MDGLSLVVLAAAAYVRNETHVCKNQAIHMTAEPRT